MLKLTHLAIHFSNIVGFQFHNTLRLKGKNELPKENRMNFSGFLFGAGMYTLSQ